jgi:molybdopterin converting factor small subunit
MTAGRLEHVNSGLAIGHRRADLTTNAIGGTTVVTVRYFAAARAAAGLPSEDIDICDGATVADALEAITSRHGDALRKVLAACSFLVDSVAVRDRTTPLRPGAELDVLPPFAGG